MGKSWVKVDSESGQWLARLFPDLVGDLLMGMRSICLAAHFNVAGFKPPAQL